jgi:prefoldin subunit 4
MAATMSVTRADQDKINMFARRHQSNLEVKSEITRIQLEIQKINDALDEIELHDEETDGKIPYQMGDLYVFLTQEETEEYIRDEQRNAAKRMNVLEDKKKDNDKHLKDLKQVLYEKFGKDINLEDEA